MKSTGVVRRIDDLGRIVIPKEIRRTFRIKNGESLEIFLENENIILKKYSSFDSLKNFYRNYVESVYSEINKSFIITDRDRIVAVSPDIRKQYIDKRISKKMESIIQNRENYFTKGTENFDIILDSKSNLKICCAVSTIIVNGDAIGSVVMFSPKELTEYEIKTTLIAAKFLGKYVEQ